MSGSQQLSSSRVGVYVDVANLSLNGGYHLQYGVLREFACRDGAIPTRLNAYVAYDPERARRDQAYRERSVGFHAVLRDYGYKIGCSLYRQLIIRQETGFAQAGKDWF